MKQRSGFALFVPLLILGALTISAVVWLYQSNQSQPQQNQAYSNSSTTAENPSVASSENWTTYTNKDFGFSLQYPPDLHLQATTTPGSPSYLSLFFLADKNVLANTTSYLGHSIPSDPSLSANFGYPLAPAGEIVAGGALSNEFYTNPNARVRKITIDGINGYVITIRYPNTLNNEAWIFREVLFARPNEFIGFNSILPNGDLDTLASEKFMIDKVIDTLKFIPFQSAGPAGTETFRMEEHHSYGDSIKGLTYDINNITATQVQMRVSSDNKTSDWIFVPLNRPTVILGHEFTVIKIEPINVGTSYDGRPIVVNIATVVIK